MTDKAVVCDMSKDQFCDAPDHQSKISNTIMRSPTTVDAALEPLPGTCIKSGFNSAALLWLFLGSLFYVPLQDRVPCTMNSSSRLTRALRTTSILNRQFGLAKSARYTYNSRRLAKISLFPRCFSKSCTYLKKGGKSRAITSQADSNSAGSAREDPYDFSSLDKGIADAHEKLKDHLRKVRPGGKLNTEVLENLRVRLDKDSNNVTRLGDLAQFVPRGRMINIMVGEEAHKRPITSAIQSSELNLQPQPDPANPLQLNITVPGATAESRKEAVAAAGKAEQTAIKAVRDARQAQHKKHNHMQKSKSALPDDLKKAGGKMEKVVESGLAEVKKIADAAKRALESS
ncbi:hypothetical protein FH972_026033 [Carpinus fangiana]|uniref:Ribosome-recycling factor, chloroplastic n=1 Tax=Carpinus fangiana TaxID=176857 RepID=A0A5N6L346_9ROSI|nr:hypothetical protein FH972_026033 [Carpinus fangiana]